MKKYPHYLIALVIGTVQITLLALIFGNVQDRLISIVAGTVLVVLIVVVTVVVISGRTTGISSIFKAIGSSLVGIILAASEFYDRASALLPDQDAITDRSTKES